MATVTAPDRVLTTRTPLAMVMAARSFEGVAASASLAPSAPLLPLDASRSTRSPTRSGGPVSSTATATPRVPRGKSAAGPEPRVPLTRSDDHFAWCDVCGRDAIARQFAQRMHRQRRSGPRSHIDMARQRVACLHRVGGYHHPPSRAHRCAARRSTPRHREHADHAHACDQRDTAPVDDRAAMQSKSQAGENERWLGHGGPPRDRWGPSAPGRNGKVVTPTDEALWSIDITPDSEEWRPAPEVSSDRAWAPFPGLPPRTHLRAATRRSR